MNAKRKKQLEKIIAAARTEIDQSDQAELEKVSKPLVGAFFRCRNNYSCPEKPSDYWWMYRRVTGADGNRLTTVDFWKDQYGRCVVENGYTFTHLLLETQHANQISERDYFAAWRQFHIDVVTAAGV